MNAKRSQTKKTLQRRIDELTAQIEQVQVEMRTLRGRDRRTRQWKRRRELQIRVCNLGEQMRRAHDGLLVL